MNVFILNTGRCGSYTFHEACSHIKNFTSGHESRSTILGPNRLDYPENHIESDNRLSWLLGRLDKKYGDNAYYVHLLRNEKDLVYSFASGIDFFQVCIQTQIILPVPFVIRDGGRVVVAAYHTLSAIAK